MQKIFSVSSNKQIHRLLHQRPARHEEALFSLAIATQQCGVAVIQQETKNIKNSDLCQPVKVEVLNVINCKVWTDISRPMCESGGCESARFFCPYAKRK